ESPTEMARRKPVGLRSNDEPVRRRCSRRAEVANDEVDLVKQLDRQVLVVPPAPSFLLARLAHSLRRVEVAVGRAPDRAEPSLGDLPLARERRRGPGEREELLQRALCL